MSDDDVEDKIVRFFTKFIKFVAIIGAIFWILIIAEVSKILITGHL